MTRQKLSELIGKFIHTSTPVKYNNQLYVSVTTGEQMYILINNRLNKHKFELVGESYNSIRNQKEFTYRKL